MQAAPNPLEVPVPKERWLHLSTAVLKELSKQYTGTKSGSRPDLAERLYIKRVAYGKLSLAQLKAICDKAGATYINHIESVATRLVEKPYPSQDELNAEELEKMRREQRAQQAAAAAAAAPPQNWNDCMKRLVKRTEQLGGTMVSQKLPVLCVAVVMRSGLECGSKLPAGVAAKGKCTALCAHHCCVRHWCAEPADVGDCHPCMGHAAC